MPGSFRGISTSPIFKDSQPFCRIPIISPSLAETFERAGKSESPILQREVSPISQAAAKYFPEKSGQAPAKQFTAAIEVKRHKTKAGFIFFISILLLRKFDNSATVTDVLDQKFNLIAVAILVGNIHL